MKSPLFPTLSDFTSKQNKEADKILFSLLPLSSTRQESALLLLLHLLLHHIFFSDWESVLILGTHTHTHSYASEGPLKSPDNERFLNVCSRQWWRRRRRQRRRRRCPCQRQWQGCSIERLVPFFTVFFWFWLLCSRDKRWHARGEWHDEATLRGKEEHGEGALRRCQPASLARDKHVFEVH